ncbi:hypothetical protein Moror_6877 [Moniliophthora roreri MCA 2997]|uniref:Uncharacterized protein n=1 Tax=Moniliophthora roreri (strain MCA 2997) TaxID=1381753 RepID=V2XSD2_MONRO|nr:hypothetical protein Moror_6877 [Moniliophthora roreri MCA 2997]
MVIIKTSPSLRIPSSYQLRDSRRRRHPYLRCPICCDEEDGPYVPRIMDDELHLVQDVLQAERRRILERDANADEEREGDIMEVRALVILYLVLLTTMLVRHLLMMGLLYRIASGTA